MLILFDFHFQSLFDCFAVRLSLVDPTIERTMAKLLVSSCALHSCVHQVSWYFSMHL